MRVEEIKQTAFAKYLLSVPRQTAIRHIGDCISEGVSDSLVWDLLEATEARLGKDAGRSLYETADEMLKTLEMT